MTIAEIKIVLNVQSLPLKWAVSKDDVTSEEWLRYWDNTNRQDIHMHIDVADAIANDAELATLELQTEVRTTEKGEYTFQRIVNFKADRVF